MNTVKVKKYSDVIEEYVAAAAITPGMLLEYTVDREVQPHSEADGTAIPMFALEDELQGNDIEDDYAIDDPVQVWIAGRGDQVRAILADGETVAIGEYLVSHGDGYLALYEATSAGESPLMQIVAQALEALDLSGSSGGSSGRTGDTRILVRVV